MPRLQLKALPNLLERRSVVWKTVVLEELKPLGAKAVKARYTHDKRRGDPRRSWRAAIVNAVDFDCASTPLACGRGPTPIPGSPAR